MLNFWEKDFKNAIDKHKEFLLKNLEDQDIYSSKFSEILEEMDIFQSEDEDERKEENQPRTRLYTFRSDKRSNNNFKF